MSLIKLIYVKIETVAVTTVVSDTFWYWVKIALETVLTLSFNIEEHNEQGKGEEVQTF